MQLEFLRPDVQKWIVENTFADIGKLAFAKNPFPELDYKELLGQLSSRAKAKDKLPSWFAQTGILYPAKVSIEQTSSEKTAHYKSRLVSGTSLIDLTGGFGVDDYYFSKAVDQVTHCEMNASLSAIAAHNFERLAASNLTCHSGNSTDILNQLGQQFDWIYVDPSRRNESKGKVFLLRDCLPDVPDLLDFYFGFSDNIMIKTAPLLDITAALSELKNVQKIHIVAVHNEVKELLFILRKDHQSEIEIITSNLLNDSNQDFSFTLHEVANSSYSEPLHYLYEPNPAIYKSGAFDLIGTRFGLSKLYPHSHLYTSEMLNPDFPGRIFEIIKSVPYDKANMKSLLQGKKANISVRNFPETVDKLRAKWKIADGGELYCFFTTIGHNDKIVVLSRKISS